MSELSCTQISPQSMDFFGTGSFLEPEPVCESSCSCILLGRYQFWLVSSESLNKAVVERYLLSIAVTIFISLDYLERSHLAQFMGDGFLSLLLPPPVQRCPDYCFVSCGCWQCLVSFF